MRDNTISWLGNRVLDPKSDSSSSRTQRYQQNYDSIPTQSTNREQSTTQSEQEQRGQVRPAPITNQTQQAPMQQMPMQQPMQQTPMVNRQGPPTLSDPNYLPAHMKTLIGRGVRAEFVLGTNIYLDKTGVLREVGVNYFVLEDFITGSLIICDLYSVKFITTVPTSGRTGTGNVP